MASYPNVNAANKCARDAVAGKIAACKYVRRGCQLHLDDLARSEKRGFRSTFDCEMAEELAELIRPLPYAKGKWAVPGQRGSDPKQSQVRQPLEKFLQFVLAGRCRPARPSRIAFTAGLDVTYAP